MKAGPEVEVTVLADASRRRRIAAAAAVAVLLAAAYANGLGALALSEPDEGRYAGIAAEMVRGGDWLTPRLDGIRYFEKPPLFFWLSALSMRTFGISEAAARLPSAIAGWLGSLLLLRWGWRAGGAACGIFAATILATIPLYAGLAHVVIVDVVLTLFVALALYASYRACVEPARGERVGRVWILAAWASAGAATLVKGPIGLVLPASAVAAYLAFRREWARLLAFLRPDGPLVYLAVVAPWFVAMQAANPEYLDAFLVGQYWGRFTGHDGFGRNRPAWYYLPVVVAAFVPWSLLLPSVVRGVWRDPDDDALASRLSTFLLCAIAAPLAVLSMSEAKLAYYVLPLAPPFALLVAQSAARIAVGAPGAPRRALATIALVMATSVALAEATLLTWGASSPASLQSFASELFGSSDDPAVTSEHLEIAVSVARAALPFVAVGSAALFASALLVRARRERAALGAMLAGLLVLTSGAPWAASRADAVAPAKEVSTWLADADSDGRPIVLYTEFLRGVPFYLGRNVTLWTADFTEFGHDVGDGEATGRSLEASRTALQDLLRETPRVLVVVDDDVKLGKLRAFSPVPLEPLAHAHGRTLLASRREPR